MGNRVDSLWFFVLVAKLGQGDTLERTMSSSIFFCIVLEVETNQFTGPTRDFASARKDGAQRNFSQGTINL